VEIAQMVSLAKVAIQVSSVALQTAQITGNGKWQRSPQNANILKCNFDTP